MMHEHITSEKGLTSLQTKEVAKSTIEAPDGTPGIAWDKGQNVVCKPERALLRKSITSVSDL